MEDVTSPRRVPAGAKAEQRIRDILRVSREVFAELGYERTTTTEIAQRLGISEGTVFTYFHGKRELCARVIEDWYDEIIGTVEQGMPHGQSTKVQLEFYVRTHLRLFLIQGTGLCALVLSEGRAKGPGLGEVFVPLQRRYTAPLMDLLARARDNGEIRDDLPLSLLRSAILGPMEHILWDAIARQRQVDIEKTARDMVALLWPALLPVDVEVEKLRAFYGEVGAALRRAGNG
ncbi:transcriptional regulator TetR/AcrR family [Cupriavidus necator N-1]|jgi:AcrR family transcriptional regulator|uniref:Transcriptional regulator TetR/AcrR family n=1 Tax=Cupriavidus necator (strain ATCC 43291 / DSM 13513 / CCUG 52238 / LMG 8453 / N-1) TaxID=1042878 RepID=G0EXS3_CUPNN|nr:MULTISPECIES: TetR/AcrR family transcriptional regulator [Cupriavidus]AEI77280.1 transcriptional regulator TetR/AcrR family [Cupriavidus necator N-1]EYS96702.1 TetR family transcriptional regulator [Cupriavidus sp. SK-4]KAI3607329.1 putative transcriptional regulator LiuQ of leucine degradation pathway, TetR family [Cupriavidus necator H850]MDX6014167.1 TetR/AcrR family transcriptional regulator [Cupriavidus necator]QUN26787.1 TetR/AcrR family transcriptional regulator [Cupriavidus sp. KK10